MSKFVIQGSKPLQGEVQVRGAKNAALPILAATLLADSPSLIRNIPHLLDVETMLSVLESLGCKVEKDAKGRYQPLAPALFLVMGTASPYHFSYRLFRFVLFVLDIQHEPRVRALREISRYR